VVGVAMVNIGVIHALIFLGRQLGVVDRLDLMPVGEVGMVRRFHLVVMIICISGRELMLGCRLEVMRSLAVVKRGLVVHIVLMLCRHRSSP